MNIAGKAHKKEVKTAYTAHRTKTRTEVRNLSKIGNTQKILGLHEERN